MIRPAVVFVRRFLRRLPPGLRALWRTAVWGFWLVYFSFIVLVLALRYSILPNIESYRPLLERLASQQIGQTVSIGRIEASWHGINPDLSLYDVQVHDPEGRPALAFSRVDAILSWWSASSAQLKLRLLSIENPTLNLRRDVNGKFHIAGVPLGETQGKGNFTDWALAQWRIRVRNATLVWDDELRQAPTLTLRALDFSLDNAGRRHLFGLSASPPEHLASRLDLRGDLRSASFKWLGGWSGTLFTELDYVDLAAWRQWIDYPLSLPHGRGALRAWAGFANGKLNEITADLLLNNASFRLAKELPALDLQRMSGRLGVRFLTSGYAVKGQGIALESAAHDSEAIVITPTDFQAEWQPGPAGGAASGKASASQIDLTALSRLAGHLPLDERSRQMLRDYAPRGRLRDLTASWKGDGTKLQTYALKAGFADLALKAQGNIPGFCGLGGHLEANEKGGSVNLSSQASSIDLPAVFPKNSPEPHTRLDSLKAQARWSFGQEGLKVDLQKMEFAGPEAAGSAQGVYRYSGQGAGEIDLTAALTRADARAVWRYMPKSVGDGSRRWLRSSLLAGRASEARLTLKGNLDDFPFLDKSKGRFLVTVKAQDVVIDYAKGWPRIDGVHGDIRFEGLGMVVDAHQGNIFATKIGKTRVEIPDFEIDVPILHVNGQVDGPTAEFLKFIDRSPVARRIDNFTEDMRASGNGHLDLKLKIPLDEARIDESTVDGLYRFKNNEVTVDTALPPIRQVNGSLQFSGSDLHIPEITGTLFGGPLVIKGGLQKDGRVLITADGSINIAQLRKETPSPWLAHLSGGTPYKGEVRINRRNADLVVDSELIGLESRLPEPFAKSALDILPLRFEKKILAVTEKGKSAKIVREGLPARDQITLSLGKLMSAQAIRRRQDDGFALERGAIAFGRPLQLPESGLSLGVTSKRLDLDAWRQVLRDKDSPPASSAEKPSGLLPQTVQLRTGELILFGRRLNEVDLTAQSRPQQWRLRLASRQAAGELAWDTAGRGKLAARLQRLKVESAGKEQEVAPENIEDLQELPAMDVIADDFQIGERRFGRLELAAHNEAGDWKLSKVQIVNPYGQLNGSGEWKLGAAKNQTQLDFRVEASDAGKLLDQLGHIGAVNAASAKLRGKIGWNGSPTAFDFASLNGEMKLDVGKGQFLKLDPGAGKLLGLLSLQSLPRRITLDFRDIFSEGFAFDGISSKLNVRNGIMQTDRLQIDGVAARVLMRGEVDLKQETQRLSVNVQPELGGTAALGVALVNPLAGVATLLAHKVLQNPLNQMFGFDYLVTGAWDDPKVEKLTRRQETETSPHLPQITE